MLKFYKSSMYFNHCICLIHVKNDMYYYITKKGHMGINFLVQDEINSLEKISVKEVDLSVLNNNFTDPLIDEDILKSFIHENKRIILF